uniref:Nitrogen regulatory protein P-II n=1 Tax=Cyanidium caldarium TaxID=2771 RepID=GLNB_CYACA|nr:nitrogen regulatory protein PII [Cyanidium caldarium]Q9TM37.1 RecName: Full=Nitrogen regulatory protein P-II [Cyanidium caldarium]AAF13016.1 unknown [Cyanidium caldarium]WDB00156.1 nitrogen regulatory protein PII [Cyanidium caldarium]
MFSKLEAIIRPFKLEEVKVRLMTFGVPGITVTNVMGCGKQIGGIERSKGVEYDSELIEKVKIEIVVMNEHIDELIEIIINAVWTGEIGDGKIFVSPVSSVIRIRTQDKDLDAI